MLLSIVLQAGLAEQQQHAQSQETTQWPSLTHGQQIAIILANVLSFVAAYILLRLIWPPPTEAELLAQKQLTRQIQELTQRHQSYLSLQQQTTERDSNGHTLHTDNNNVVSPSVKNDVAEIVECLEGESAGDYSAPWTETFDYWFVVIMSAAFIMLSIWTTWSAPQLWFSPYFWLEQIPKLATMMLVSYCGGMLCRYFCEHDEIGYIITSKKSLFKVNYTRKLQHFAAYLVPLLLHSRTVGIEVSATLTLAWGNWVTLLGFLILIKPLRERSEFVMLQFNALDRPEDRPSTLSWIVGGNIIPGCILIVFFRWLYSFTGQSDLTYIFLFITGIGDGLAEPVGIYLGKHKYWTKSLFGDRRYQRSWEGSACVFISAVLFNSFFYYTFATAAQFWVAMLILPPLMTYAEATSPHTLDTPFLMGLGGAALYFISHIHMEWK